MLKLKTVQIRPSARERSEFPFNLPVVAELEELELGSPVTFLVGENGAGKSTLLEAIAVGVRAVTVGAGPATSDKTLAHAQALAAHMRFSWEKRTSRGLFMRAEDFFGYAKHLRRTKEELDQMVEEIDRTSSGYGRMLARGALLGQKQALDNRYGGDVDARSHGESFLALFQSRFVPGGLYLLDEPEAPLSPRRQIALLALLLQMIEEDAQFIIATHSPILMACPGAAIIDLDQHPPVQVPYAELDHVFITKTFLENPERYLRHLNEPEE